MNDFIKMKDILNIINDKYGYGTHSDLNVYMQELTDEKDKYLVIGRTITKYFKKYALRKDPSEDMYTIDYTKYIRVSGQGTKGLKYNKVDVLKFLEDEDVKRKLEDRLKSKTIYFDDMNVPKCIIKKYVEDMADDMQAIEITGYTREELQYFSVPEELLYEKKQWIQEEIINLKKELKLINEVLGL